MAMKDGHAPNDRVGEVHNDVDGAAVWNIHGVQPQRIGNWSVVLRVRQEMHLMDMHGMQFSSGIDNLPMLIRADLCAYHSSAIGRELFPVDAKSGLVFPNRAAKPRSRF